MGKVSLEPWPMTADVSIKILMAQDLLLRVKNSAQRGSIQLEDVIKILSNSVFTAEEGLLSVTDNKVRPQLEKYL